ncbi:MAG: prolyl oligopeptidase family serine peptidase [Fidelibacterota bacterium]|nr:MAG: prolyl oligopeptidase family serine peptidase [Candidatus Neomarinimicrobiota bacterium]
MMKFSLWPYFGLLIWIGSLSGQGTLVDDRFYSPSLDTVRWVDVHLPPGYDPADGARRYPVVYFLHSWGDDHDDYSSSLVPTWDSLIAAGAIAPAILVKPDGSVDPWQGSWYTNSARYGLFEDYIAADLVAYIDSAYHTIPESGQRSVLGHSMGGYGALKMGFKHPDVFHGAASISGVVELRSFSDTLFAWATEDYEGSGPLLPQAGIYSEILYSGAAAFSPNMDRPPYFVDLPFDAAGSRIASIWSRWLQHDPGILATKVAREAYPALYFDCGTTEALWPLTLTFARTLDSLGVPYRFVPVEGAGHSTHLEQRFTTALIFLDSAMREK